MDAALDAPEVIETPDAVEEPEGLEPEPEPSSEAEPAAPPDGKEDPYTTKFSREYRAALNQWKASHPEAAKFAKQAQDNHGRLFALNQIEPQGVDGVREKYALLQAIGGPEGLTGLQERLAATDETDRYLAEGNPKVLEAFGDEFNGGLAKLAPHILDRVAKTDPQAFEAAIMPHVVSTIASSDVIKHFNDLIDVLNTKDDPRFDEKTKAAFTFRQLAKMGEAFNSLETKAKTTPAGPDDERTKFEQERTQFEQEKQETHWNTTIRPQAVKLENDKFSELLKPLLSRLRLNDRQKDAALRDFKANIGAAFKADNDYQRQLKIYRSQKNPDPAAVTNFLKVTLQRHAQTAFDAVKEDRWSSFLNGKPQPRTATTGRPQAATPGVEIRSVKPADNEIDWTRTKRSDVWDNKFVLKNGKTVQYRPA